MYMFNFNITYRVLYLKSYEHEDLDVSYDPNFKIYFHVLELLQRYS